MLGKRDYYLGYKGLSRGGHDSIREGGFSVCGKNNQCDNKTPRGQMNV